MPFITISTRAIVQKFKGITTLNLGNQIAALRSTQGNSDMHTAMALEEIQNALFGLNNAIATATLQVPSSIISDKATFDLNDTTVNTDVTPHVPVRFPGNALELTGVVKKDITADLVCNVKQTTSSGTTTLGSITIPAHTLLNKTISVTSFTNKPQKLAVGDILSIDITASDGSSDPDGVATVVLRWE